MNRAALIDQIQQARETLLQSAPVERDRFVSHLYQSRREYRRTCETAGESAPHRLRTDPVNDRSAQPGFGVKSWGSFRKLVAKIYATKEVFVALAGQTDWQNLFCFVCDNFTGCDLRRVREHRD